MLTLEALKALVAVLAESDMVNGNATALLQLETAMWLGYDTDTAASKQASKPTKMVGAMPVRK